MPEAERRWITIKETERGLVKISASINKAESFFKTNPSRVKGSSSSCWLLYSFVHDRVSYFFSSISIKINLLSTPLNQKLREIQINENLFEKFSEIF